MTKQLSIGAIIAAIICIASCSLPDDYTLNIKLEYDGKPLIMLDEIAYPDGRKMLISRFSFYISDLAFDNEAVSVVELESEYINLSETHFDETSASNGYELSFIETAVDDADIITFNLGLTEAQNNTTPGDHSARDPLALSGEYWPSWESYIFTKIEGKLDFDNDGIIGDDENFVLHLGSSELRREVSFPIASPNETIQLIIDAKDVFQRNGLIYDIDNTRQIHTLTPDNIEKMNELSDNFRAAIRNR